MSDERRPKAAHESKPPAADGEGAAPEDRPDRANTDATTVLPETSILLQHALGTGDPSVVAVVRRIVDGRAERQAASIRARRERLFDPADVERLEMDDRRREAARRLPVICEDTPHSHALGCADSIAATG